MDSRVITLTPAAHKYGNLTIRSCGRDFFPPDVFGHSSRAGGLGVPITLRADGLSTPIKTDIPIDKMTGKPRWFFRERRWVKEFVSHHRLGAGDAVTIERLAKRTYRVKLNNAGKTSAVGNVCQSGYELKLLTPTMTKPAVRKVTDKQELHQDDNVTPENRLLDEAGLDARKLNIVRSPKKGGSSSVDSIPYLEQLNVDIVESDQPIHMQFAPNTNEPVHRWASYVQGFSALFVQTIFNRYRESYRQPVVLDPFAGCGTVIAQAKFNGYTSIGTELNPLLQFIAQTKVNLWDVSPSRLLEAYKQMPKNKSVLAPSFLKSTSQFRPSVLRNLETINGGIVSMRTRTEEQEKTKNLLRLAFSAILVDCSNLKRSPCLGYVKNKIVKDSAPFVLFEEKVHDIADDLQLVQSQYKDSIYTEAKIFCSNAMTFKHRHRFDLAITSPPYMNGLDYVMNYKIEMGWLEFVHSQRDLKKIKDDMVVCDNVSKGLIRKFYQCSSTYTNDWIEKIKTNIEKNIIRRGAYRRQDMPYIVHKYFDDMFRVMENVVVSLKRGGRFILVVGDSLIADVYVPTDLLIAKIGLDLGLKIEKIEKARERRSGQIRSYRLRESIVTLLKA